MNSKELDNFLFAYTMHETEGYKYYLDAMKTNNMDLLSIVDLGYKTYPPNVTLNEKYPIRFHRHERYCRRTFHAHQFLEIMYQYSGQCIQNIEGDTQLLHQGEICIIPPGVYHSPDVFDESILMNLIIELDVLKQLWEIWKLPHGVLNDFLQSVIYQKQYPKYLMVFPHNNPDLHNLLQEMIAEYYNNEIYMQDILSAKIHQLLFFLIRWHAHNMIVSDQYILKKDAFLPVLQSVQLADLSKRFSYSETYICRMIHATTGKTFSEHLLDLRISRAKILLLTTAMSFSEIAGYCGYQGDAYFHRTFKRIVGITPIEYRKANK